MQKKIMSWKTKGMSRDLSVSAFNPEFSFENINLRLSTNEGNTQMSWVNERGTAAVSLVTGKWNVADTTNTANVTSISGTPIGTAVLNHQLVVFTSGTLDYIYIFKFADADKTRLMGKILYQGDLNFSVEHPLETLISYESELVQKVYWTDGVNQLRVINVVGSIASTNNNQFDFVPTLQLQETITVSKKQNSAGSFPAGVIQYAFTYYNKYGQESNIFYISPLRYVSPLDRGGAPDERVSNAFEITIKDYDRNFDYLRIYSIQRTSLDGTPICKRVADIKIKDLSSRIIAYTDTGTTGDSVDPTELLFKGGETVAAETFTQKDNTLFLGNIKIIRPNLQTLLLENGFYSSSTHKLLSVKVSVDDSYNDLHAPIETPIINQGYHYFNQLNAFNSSGEYGVPCAGFKRGDTYRCGVQFQYKTGKWTEPFFVKDLTVPDVNYPALDFVELSNIRLTGIISPALTQYLLSCDYKKARAVIVYPEIQDRKTVCQGVLNPTVFTENHRNTNKDLLSQSSWFFRPMKDSSLSYLFDNQTASPWSGGVSIPYTKRNKGYSPIADSGDDHPYGEAVSIRQVEVQGFFNYEDRFQVDWSVVTLHSPDIEFDDQLSFIDYSDTKLYKTGNAIFSTTMSDIDIQTETPTISNKGNGFFHRSFKHSYSRGIIAGLFYDDYAVDDTDEDQKPFESWKIEGGAFKWMVYPWQKNGSLTNDISRPSNKGTTSSLLKKKVISNLRYANTSPITAVDKDKLPHRPELFSSDEVSIVKVGYPSSDMPNIYMGNVDTILNSELHGTFVAFDGSTYDSAYSETRFQSDSWWKIYAKYDDDGNVKQHGLYQFHNDSRIDKWGHPVSQTLGNHYEDLVINKSSIRMKYKSSPHLVFYTDKSFADTTVTGFYLPIVDIRRQNIDNPFGGTSLDALKANVWIPCGKPVVLGNKTDDNTGSVYTKINYNYGDTYLQRWDCLKTYPFTKEDPNQIVEIGSFVLESHINTDGRYDKNRGQLNNLNMSPQNFNLLNPVYSQRDNFFSYRIMDDNYYKNSIYPNQITWSKTKQSNADTDMWNNVTLANTLELDGNKGKITSLQRLNDQLICFQDQGIAQILYNENTQISTEAGVPVEIANSGKVQGNRYLSDTVGCSNKWSICSTPSGLYFMDSIGKNIFLFNGELRNISMQYGFDAWSKMTIPSQDKVWTPNNFDSFISHYDPRNQEVEFVSRDIALAWSEKLGVFTSFYDYGNTPWLCSIDDVCLWLRKDGTVWKHQSGDYGVFFGESKGYSITLIGNPEPQTDKIFTNLEFRSCVDDEGVFEEGFSRFTPYLPFNRLEVWNEYQRGIAHLGNRTGRELFKHHDSSGNATLKRKFRIWRCDIPRNNVGTVTTPIPTFDNSFDESFYQKPVESNRRPTDRMRNPWLYLKLAKDVEENEALKRTEIHDLLLTYFN